jgi:Suppressor of fused protein (SUFU)
MSNPGDTKLIESVDRHISRYVAPVGRVYHEIVSDDLHIDIHHVAPARRRPFHTLVTSGMSEMPMNTGADAAAWRFAELCVLLEPTWRLEPESFQEERWYWPLRLLKGLSRYPLAHDTWLGYGHSVATGDPPKPFAEDTDLCACALLPPLSLGVEFSRMRRSDGADTYFWSVMPIYANEMEFKLQHGADALMDAFDKAGITDIVSRDRACALGMGARRRWWPFGSA